MNQLSEIGLIRKKSKRQVDSNKKEKFFQLPSSFSDLWRNTKGVLYADRTNTVRTLNYSSNVLMKLLRQSDKNYCHFEVPKRDSKETRTVSAPIPQLKYLQKHLLYWMYENTTVAEEAHGFVEKRGNWTAAADIAIYTRNQKKVTIFVQDLRKAFDSVTEAQVRTIFSKLGLKGFQLHYATRITTHNGKLATGAPTSPHLLNLLLKEIDQKLSDWAKSQGGIYRRYADDLSFAFPTWEKEVVKKAKHILQRLFKSIGIELHPKKNKRTRLGIDSDSAEVIGIAVQQNRATRPKRLRNRLRGKIRQTRSLLKSGNIEAAEKVVQTVYGLAAYFTGELTIVRQIRARALMKLNFRNI
jgi:RNA-directed DNA polymerase